MWARRLHQPWPPVSRQPSSLSRLSWSVAVRRGPSWSGVVRASVRCTGGCPPVACEDGTGGGSACCKVPPLGPRQHPPPPFAGQHPTHHHTPTVTHQSVRVSCQLCATDVRPADCRELCESRKKMLCYVMLTLRGQRARAAARWARCLRNSQPSVNVATFAPLDGLAADAHVHLAPVVLAELLKRRSNTRDIAAASALAKLPGSIACRHTSLETSQALRAASCEGEAQRNMCLPL
jgi:hypothetical protein